MNDIYTRKRKLELDKPMNGLSYKDIYRFLENNKYFMNSIASKFMDATPESYIYLMEIMKDQLTENNYSYIIKIFVDNCLIYYHDLDSVKNFVMMSAITQSVKDKLISIIDYLKTIDRLSFNHDSISKRFNIYSLFDNTGYKYTIITDLCKLIDTYNYPNIVKMKLCIDEFFILNHFNEKITLDVAESIFIILLYYLIKIKPTEGEALSIIKDIDTHASKYIKDSHIDILVLYSSKTNPYQQAVMEKDPIKYINDNTIKMNDGWETLAKVFTFVYVYTNTLDDADNVGMLDVRIKPIVNFVTKTTLRKGIEFMEDKINVKELINPVEAIKTEEDEHYSFESVQDDLSNDHVVYSITVTDVSQICREVEKINSYLKTCIKALAEFYMQDANPMGGIDLNEKNFVDYVHTEDDNRFRIMVKHFRIYDIEKFENDDHHALTIYLENLDRVFRNILFNSRYFVKLECSSDYGLYIYLVSKYTVELDIEEEDNKDLSPDVYKAAYDLKVKAEEMQNFYDSHYETLLKVIGYLNHPNSIAAERVTLREFKMINHLITYILGDNSIIATFMERAKKEKGNTTREEIDRIYKEENSDDTIKNMYDRGEAVQLLEKIVSNIGSVNEDAGSVLNTLALAWQGFKSKAKNFDAKQKEMSRDMDMNFNGFMRSMKKALVGDRREQIIRGEICPSLSKMIKVSVALIVAGVASSTVVVPAIGALGWLGMSKMMTNKEVGYIIDEIDIELKVLDREIQKAENSGSPKKYRNLLSIQKKLMRERQRIQYKYALAGKKIRPITDFNKGAGTSD
jgi:hypothetical protein